MTETASKATTLLNLFLLIYDYLFKKLIFYSRVFPQNTKVGRSTAKLVARTPTFSKKIYPLLAN